jgi:hypothetical protein
MNTLQVLLRIIRDDLGIEQHKEFVTVLRTIDEVQEDTRQKLSECKAESDAAQLFSDFDVFEKVVCDYYREIFRRIAERNSSNASSEGEK